MAHRSARLAGGIVLVAAYAGGSSLASPSPPATGAGSVPAQHVSTHHHRRHAAAKPATPVASAAPASAAVPASSPAPVPNEAVNAPIDNAGPDASVAPSVFQLHYPPQGDGYTTGSSSQALDDREAAKATGVEVKVPLPQ